MRNACPLCHAMVLVIALAAASPAMASITLFSEDFQTFVDPLDGPQPRCAGPGGPGTYPFPSGWLLRNVDNRTPHQSVSYVDEAWEVREDFTDQIANCIAFSTSFYAPIGAAEDWMWTPLIGPIPALSRLTWRARSYSDSFLDGYEVRVMVAPDAPTGGTGVIGNQLTNSTVVFSTAAEASDWTSHSVDLGAHAGQSVYIGFRNHSNDKFVLVIDDVHVEELIHLDPELLDVVDVQTRGYAKLPAALGYGFEFRAQVRNSGIQPLSSTVVNAELLVDGLPVDDLGFVPVGFLTSGTTQTVFLGDKTYNQIGTWSVEARVFAEADGNPANSTLSKDLAEVTVDELTRAQGVATGTMGIGAGMGGELGIDFIVPQRAKLHAARIAMDNNDILPPADPPATPGDGVGDFNGFTLSMVLRSWSDPSPSIGEPDALMATATATIAADAAVGPMTVAFDFGGVILPPGRYLLAVVEPTVPEPRTMTLHTMTQRFTHGTNWMNFPTSPFGWFNPESFSQVDRTFDITAILGLPVIEPAAQADTFVVPQSGAFAGDVSPNDTISDDGGNHWSVSSPPATGTLAMQSSGAFEYTPAASAAGSTIAFGYTLCDVDDDCSTATVELQV